jgi:hypothetical protein
MRSQCIRAWTGEIVRLAATAATRRPENESANYSRRRTAATLGISSVATELASFAMSPTSQTAAHMNLSNKSSLTSCT